MRNITKSKRPLALKGTDGDAQTILIAIDTFLFAKRTPSDLKVQMFTTTGDFTLPEIDTDAVASLMDKSYNSVRIDAGGITVKRVKEEARGLLVVKDSRTLEEFTIFPRGLALVHVLDKTVTIDVLQSELVVVNLERLPSDSEVTRAFNTLQLV